MKKKKVTVKTVLLAMVGLAIVGIIILFGINAYVKSVAKDHIISTEEAETIEDADCILVLGCQVKSDGSPSKMLNARLETGIELYNLGAAPKLLMSGDHGTEEYNEVETMKQLAIEAGVPSSDVFMDHAGFSTYESIYRAKEVFEADKIIIVTQEYHLYRALYIADKLGVEAYGVASGGDHYSGQYVRDAREVLARVKDFATAMLRPEPTYLGETIPVSGDGNITNDE